MSTMSQVTRICEELERLSGVVFDRSAFTTEELRLIKIRISLINNTLKQPKINWGASQKRCSFAKVV